MRIPSLIKKYLMALSGLVLVLFVLGHMAGNLLFFAGPEAINAYAYNLHNMPGDPVTLWVIRLFLLGAVAVHVWMAVLLTKENRAARPDTYLDKKSRASTYAARTMPMTGLILLAFIVFHILQFTVRIVPENYEQTIGESMVTIGFTQLAFFDVYAMMVKGFSSPLIVIFYIVAVGLLCLHLTHGVSSMFQSIGFRNELWRPRLRALALVYGWVIFLGFASIPASVMIGGVGQDYLAHKQAEWSAASTQPAAAQPARGSGGTIR